MAMNFSKISFLNKSWLLIDPNLFRIYILADQSNNSQVKKSSREAFANEKNKKKSKQSDENFSIENGLLRLTFDKYGNLTRIESLDATKTNTALKAELTADFCYYESKVGDCKSGETQASGAYIFRPQADKPTCFGVLNFTVARHKLFSEVHQVFSDYVSQTIRLYANATSVEFDWQVGPINVDDQVGKEVIFRVCSDLKTEKYFTTDSNGRQLLKRKRDYRDSIPNYNLTERTAGNYFPINSRLILADESGELRRQLTLITDRSQGGSSLVDGCGELMLHRRILHDDNYGVREPLNELGVDQKGLRVKGKLHLIFNTTRQSVRLHRELALKVNWQPLITFGLDDSQAHNLNSLMSKSLIKSSLPANVHMLTLHQELDSAINNSIILRLEHLYEANEDVDYSKAATVDLKNAFRNDTFNLVSIEELALGANMNVEELNKRLIFKTIDENQQERLLNETPKNKKASNDFLVTLKPFEIKTFRVIVAK
jgi:lysosomal alpha-mannosidase